MKYLKLLKDELFNVISDIDDGKSNECICIHYNEYSITMLNFIRKKNKLWFDKLFKFIKYEIKNNISADNLSTELKKNNIDKKLINHIIDKLFGYDYKEDVKNVEQCDPINIDIFKNYPDIINLFNHLKVYHQVPKDYRQNVFNTWTIYENYDNMIESFNNLDESKLLVIVNDIFIKLKSIITHEQIYENTKNFYQIVRFILDCYNVAPIYGDIIADDDYDNNIDNNDNDNTFIWRDSQRKGWQASIDSDFVNGIHSQATGSGKSLIALKEINEYNKLYPIDNILWICERKDIPQKLFFNGTIKKGSLLHGVKHKQNYKFWKDNDIINMSKFHIVEHIYNKDKQWVENLNNYSGNKPIFLIINRAFMTTQPIQKSEIIKLRYQEIKNMPKFVIIDECHSSMAIQTYQLLSYLKWQCESKMHGLSATPYRQGKSNTKLVIDINTHDTVNINTNVNEEKLLNIFHKPGNVNKLNILSFFNLKDAIESGVILEPVFHWYCIEPKNDEPKKKTKLYDISDVNSVLYVLDTIIKKCRYKKCIVWCGTIEVSEEWYDIFGKEKQKHKNLKNIVQYIDHSKKKNNHYDEFYNLEDNSIIFCANKFREGSDIPYLSCCLFLDKVVDRGTIPFIQCIGRVLRKDTLNEKKYGHILDGIINENNQSKMQNTISKIIAYYTHLYDISKSEFDFKSGDIINDEKVSDRKVNLYNELSESIHINPKKKKIIIKLKNNKTMQIDITELNLNTLEWDELIPNFNKALKNVIHISDYEEYVGLQKYCQKIGIIDKYHYQKEYMYYPNLYNIYDGKKVVLDIKKRFPGYFKDWYDFLQIDTSTFIQSYDEWKKICNGLNINEKEYIELSKSDNRFPGMPEEFYIGYTNYNDIQDNITINFL